jgi:precorrin-3B synthase
VPTREPRPDGCPGALQWHQAADGGVARIRLPGGRLTADQLLVMLRAAPSGWVELTSRANVQIRGLAEEPALAVRLARAGLLPSATHERVRNIIGSPLGDGTLVRELDAGLCARPALAGLPGRFLFIVDDGRGDEAWLGGDVTALLLGPDRAAILLGGIDVGLRATRAELVPVMLACAQRFLELRTGEWRIAELADGPRRVAEPFPLVEPEIRGRPAGTRGPLGRLGRDCLGAAVPLGRLTLEQGTALASASDAIVITPWRGVVLTGLAPDRIDRTARRLAATGLLLDPGTPAVTACVGKPGCAKALADVRADAAAMLRAGTGTPVAVHWSGCARRCGRPHGDVLDVVATQDGYVVRRGLR